MTVASTGAPFYEPNPQTGEALTLDFPANASVATNTVYHNRTDFSRLIVPIPDSPTGMGGIRHKTKPKGSTTRTPGARPPTAITPAVPPPPSTPSPPASRPLIPSKR